MLIKSHKHNMCLGGISINLIEIIYLKINVWGHIWVEIDIRKGLVGCICINLKYNVCICYKFMFGDIFGLKSTSERVL